MDKMRDCPIEDENKINIVEITDQIVRYLSEEEFHMFRFCLGLQIDHAVPPKLEEHTRLFSRLLLVSARRIIAKEMDEFEIRQPFSKMKNFSTGRVCHSDLILGKILSFLNYPFYGRYNTCCFNQ